MFNPIGFVKSAVTEVTDSNWGSVVSQIVVNDDLADGLAGLQSFSHIIVVYHLNKTTFEKEKHLTRRPKGRSDMPLIGIFAQRSKNRPNGIGLTTVKLLSVNKNMVEVQGLDAIDGTPVLDIKPHYPQYDFKENVVVPDWVDVLMEGYF